METATIPRSETGLEMPERRVFPYHVLERPDDKLVERFLEAFAWVLEYTDYKPLLDSYCHSTAKCNRCAVACPVLLASGDPRDIPCYRTNLLLDTYRRYFTLDGWLSSRVSAPFELTDEIIDEMGDVFYRCTICRRCTQSCPMGFDHGLITRLGPLYPEPDRDRAEGPSGERSGAAHRGNPQHLQGPEGRPPGCSGFPLGGDGRESGRSAGVSHRQGWAGSTSSSVP